MLAERSPSIQRAAATQPEASRGQLTIPNRPGKPAFQRQQAERWPPEISFDRQTRRVTVRVSVQDVSGHFIPNLRPENFAVYEDGQLQKDLTVDVEHAPVTLAVLVEGGGRYQRLNTFLSHEIPFVIRPLLDELHRDDKIAVFSYANTIETLTDFDRPPASFDQVIERLKAPELSEAKLYDALIDVLNRMHDVQGRKAILLVSTGHDTFSHATFDDVVRAAGHSDTPVYCIGLADTAWSLIGTAGPLAKIDWKRADERLETLAKVSGGRAYLRESTIEIPAIYDDLMEHLRIRYVISYVSSNPATGGAARTVRVALVDPKTGAPLRIVDETGKAITARAILQGRYTP
jgi:VWFA-related protein